jgi:hypothetical protein
MRFAGRAPMMKSLLIASGAINALNEWIGRGVI